MKLRGEVLAVETDGESLTVQVQATEEGAAEWRSMATMTVKVSDIRNRRRALYVGRILDIEIRPRGR